MHQFAKGLTHALVQPPAGTVSIVVLPLYSYTRVYTRYFSPALSRGYPPRIAVRAERVPRLDPKPGYIPRRPPAGGGILPPPPKAGV